MARFYLTDKQGNKLGHITEEAEGLFATPYHHDSDHQRIDHFMDHLNDRRKSSLWADQPLEVFLTHVQNSTGNHYSDVQVHGE